MRTPAVTDRPRPPAWLWAARRITFVLVIVVASTALLEAMLVALRRVPALSAVLPAQTLARELYLLDRSMIQYEPVAARYDAELGYTLRPGSFEFSNTEFETSYQVNRLGVRDDEESLAAPQVVVLGDSFAMGWGVEQEEGFAEQLQAVTGMSVLNTAVSSYGTVRSLRMLRRIDLSAAEWLVIQFCDNDFFENQRFAHEGPEVRPQSQAQYLANVTDYQAARRYWPGRYTRQLLETRLGWLAPGDRDRASGQPDPDDPVVRQQQVDQFLQVMESSPVELSDLRIVVFELNAHNRNRGWFVELLRQTLYERSELPAHLRAMVTLDVASELTPQDYFQLDDHLRPRGHRVVAEHLAGVIAGPSSGATDGDAAGTGGQGWAYRRAPRRADSRPAPHTRRSTEPGLS